MKTKNEINGCDPKAHQAAMLIAAAWASGVVIWFAGKAIEWALG